MLQARDAVGRRSWAHCFAILGGETIHWEPQDGLGLKNGVAIKSIDEFKFPSERMSPAERAVRERLQQQQLDSEK
jgi:hypothetical protein